jgi:hypothetical protein
VGRFFEAHKTTQIPRTKFENSNPKSTDLVLGIWFLDLATFRGLLMHLLICTRTDAFMVSDRCGTLLESIRRFFKVLSRLYPETLFENCEWRSSLPDWPKVDAFLCIPRGGEPAMTAALEVFAHYCLESARVKKRFGTRAPIELALGFKGGRAGPLLLSAQKSLIFDDQEMIALIRSESLFPLCESVESLDRRKFRGLACAVPSTGQANRAPVANSKMAVSR